MATPYAVAYYYYYFYKSSSVVDEIYIYIYNLHVDCSFEVYTSVEDNGTCGTGIRA